MIWDINPLLPLVPTYWPISSLSPRAESSDGQEFPPWNPRDGLGEAIAFIIILTPNKNLTQENSFLPSITLSYGISMSSLFVPTLFPAWAWFSSPYRTPLLVWTENHQPAAAGESTVSEAVAAGDVALCDRPPRSHHGPGRDFTGYMDNAAKRGFFPVSSLVDEHKLGR